MDLWAHGGWSKKKKKKTTDGGGGDEIHVINPLMGMAVCQSGPVHSTVNEQKWVKATEQCGKK